MQNTTPEINLEESIDFLQIKAQRKIINDIVFKSGTLIGSIDKIITFFIDRMFDQDFFIKSLTQKKKIPEKIIKIKSSIFKRLVRASLSEPVIKELLHSISQNPYKLLVISNYAFIEHIFWLDCDFSYELKNYRAMETSDKQIIESQKYRRRAEEFYKKGHIDDAYYEFKEAEILNLNDFTITFQLALIYFFEKLDYKKAIEYFEKSAVLSSGHSSQIFIYSKILKSLILRFVAFLKRDLKMLNEAYECALEGYRIDPNYNFSKYAIIQCQIALSLTPESVDEALSSIQKLISEDKMYAIQGIYDHVFDNVIETLEKMLNDVINDLEIDCEYNFAEMKKIFEALNNQNKFMTDPSRAFNAHKEFQNLKNRATSKTYFDYKHIALKSNILMNELHEIQTDVNRNKYINDVREFTEKLIPEYNKDLKEVMAPYAQLQQKLDKLTKEKEKILELFPLIQKNKFVNLSGTQVTEGVKNGGSAESAIAGEAPEIAGSTPSNTEENAEKKEKEEQERQKRIEAAKLEREAVIKSETFWKTFKPKLNYSLLAVFILLTFIYFNFFDVENYILTIFTSLIIFSFIPLYSVIIIRTYFFIKQERFENIKREINQINFKLSIHAPDIVKVQEANQNKYASIIQEKFPAIDETASKKCLNAILNKTPDKLKNII
ncbi:MAG: hypothetical protein QMC67_00435 [Candidatus Wallbacteria bacterium]